MGHKIELKPCPFCGSDMVRLMARDPYSDEERCINFTDEIDECDVIYIKCYECGYDLSSCEDALYLVDIWNRRADKKTPADVQEVRHGRWEKFDVSPFDFWFCSECDRSGGYPNKPGFKYCPNCGARMDETEKQE